VLAEIESNSWWVIGIGWFYQFVDWFTDIQATLLTTLLIVVTLLAIIEKLRKIRKK